MLAHEPLVAAGDGMIGAGSERLANRDDCGRCHANFSNSSKAVRAVTMRVPLCSTNSSSPL